MSEYIEADAVEKIINDIRDCFSVEGYWAILQRLEKIPTADVRPNVHGEWIIKGKKIFCTKCNEPQFKYTELNIDWRPNFCPNCGADMRKGETK